MRGRGIERESVYERKSENVYKRKREREREIM